MSRQTDYISYVKLTDDERRGELFKIECSLRQYAKETSVDFNSITCRKKVLLSIVEKVEKRRVYFRVFHEIDMSEKYEVALYCFWIVKLMPFFNTDYPDRHISIKFAAYLFLKVIGKIEKTQHQFLKVKFNEDHIRNLEYAFLYWDLSKEAIMLKADLLLKQTFSSATKKDT